MIHPPANLVSMLLARVRETVQAQANGDYYQITCRAMSTPIRLAFQTKAPLTAHNYQQAAVEWIARFEATYSRFLPESLVGQINANNNNDWIEVDDDADRL